MSRGEIISFAECHCNARSLEDLANVTKYKRTYQNIYILMNQHTQNSRLFEINVICSITNSFIVFYGRYSVMCMNHKKSFISNTTTSICNKAAKITSILWKRKVRQKRFCDVQSFENNMKFIPSRGNSKTSLISAQNYSRV